MFAPRARKNFRFVLSTEEVRKLLGSVRLLSYRVCLSTISSCGLRLQEGTHLHVRDIDSSRMMIHVRHGKGGKDRYVPLPQRPLELLRQYWVTHRHPVLVFPAPGRGHAGVSSATQPMPKRSLQEACRHALTHSGIHTQASVHTLRHSWATPLLEAGVHRRLLHAYLGHNSPTTTSVYPHLTASAEQLGSGAINRVMRDL